MRNPNKRPKFSRLYLQSFCDSIFFPLEKDLIVRFIKLIFSQGCHDSIKNFRCHMEIRQYSIYFVLNPRKIYIVATLFELYGVLKFFHFFLIVTTDILFRAICRCSINSKYVLQFSIHL